METNKPIIEKLIEGMKISFEKLVEQKAAEDKELVFADDNGKVVRIKATELKKQLQQQAADEAKKTQL